MDKPTNKPTQLHPAADQSRIVRRELYNELLSELAYSIGIVTMQTSRRMGRDQIGDYLKLLEHRLVKLNIDADAHVHLGQAIARARALEFGHARNALCALIWRVVEQYESEDL